MMLLNCGKWCLRRLMSMTSVKTGIGLLYPKSGAERYKRIKAEITNTCPDIEIQADVVVDDNSGLRGFSLLSCRSHLVRWSKVKINHY